MATMARRQRLDSNQRFVACRACSIGRRREVASRARAGRASRGLGRVLARPRSSRSMAGSRRPERVIARVRKPGAFSFRRRMPNPLGYRHRELALLGEASAAGGASRSGCCALLGGARLESNQRILRVGSRRAGDEVLQRREGPRRAGEGASRQAWGPARRGAQMRARQARRRPVRRTRELRESFSPE